MNNYDVAIIGGGLTGLTTSLYLARAGLSVLVLEKAKQLGGRAMTIRKSGAALNLGLRAFYLDGEGEAVLNELGVALKGARPPASVGAILHERVYPLPASPLALLVSKLFSFPEKMELARFMMKLGKIDPARIEPISLKEWAEREIQHPMLRHVIYAVSRANSYVPHPELLLAGPAVRQLQRTFSGKAFYLDDGWATLVEDLRAKAVREGVTIVAGKKAAEIEHDGAVKRIQCADGETIDVACAVITAGPKEACELVKNAERTSLAGWQEKARPIRAACLDLVLRRLPPSGSRFVAGFWLDQPLFYNSPSGVAKLSENGAVVLHLVKHLGIHNGDPDADLQHLRKAADIMQPGWRKELLEEQFLPNMIVAHNFYNVHDQGHCGPAVPEIRGLYVAGDWTGRGELLADVALASAKRAANAILREDHAERRGLRVGEGNAV